MATPPLVYIAGPFRAPTPWEIECNVRRAEAVAYELLQLGAYPVIPHAQGRFFHGTGPDQLHPDDARLLYEACGACMPITPKNCDMALRLVAVLERLLPEEETPCGS